MARTADQGLLHIVVPRPREHNYGAGAMTAWTNDEAHRALSRASELLDKAADVLDYYTNEDLAWNGSPGSTAHAERCAPSPFDDRSWRPRVVATAFAAPRLNLMSAAEFLTSQARLLRGEAPLPGHLALEALARAVLENSGRAWWLLAPRIGVRERVARSMVDRLFSAQQAQQLADSIELSSQAAGLSEQIAIIKQLCCELGFTYKLTDHSVKVDGIPRPRPTKLVDSLLAETIYRPSQAVAFRLFSATAHGTHYAAMRSFEDRGTKVAGERFMERTFDTVAASHAIGFSLTGFEVALRRAVVLTGQGLIRIDMFRDQIHKWAWTLPSAP